MRKLLAFVALFCALSFTGVVSAQGDSTKTDTSKTTVAPTTTAATDTTKKTIVESGFRQQMKEKFIEGDYVWMTPVLLCFILGLAIAIERIIYLNMGSVNTTKLLSKIQGALNAGGIESAKNVCKSTPGPVANIFLQGLDQAPAGVEHVEKALVAHGGVEIAKMEKGLTWLSLFIALGPMLGFLGTVVGMIFAFDAIAAAGDISPNIVAGGMKVALLTTVAGLLVAIFLQIFFNYITSRIESLTGEMEESSIEFVELLEKSGTTK